MDIEIKFPSTHRQPKRRRPRYSILCLSVGLYSPFFFFSFFSCQIFLSFWVYHCFQLFSILVQRCVFRSGRGYFSTTRPVFFQFLHAILFYHSLSAGEYGVGHLSVYAQLYEFPKPSFKHLLTAFALLKTASLICGLQGSEHSSVQLHLVFLECCTS